MLEQGDSTVCRCPHFRMLEWRVRVLESVCRGRGGVSVQFSVLELSDSNCVRIYMLPV